MALSLFERSLLDTLRQGLEEIPEEEVERRAKIKAQIAELERRQYSDERGRTLIEVLFLALLRLIHRLLKILGYLFVFGSVLQIFFLMRGTFIGDDSAIILYMFLIGAGLIFITTKVWKYHPTENDEN